MSSSGVAQATVGQLKAAIAAGKEAAGDGVASAAVAMTWGDVLGSLHILVEHGRAPPPRPPRRSPWWLSSLALSSSSLRPPLPPPLAHRWAKGGPAPRPSVPVPHSPCNSSLPAPDLTAPDLTGSDLTGPDLRVASGKVKNQGVADSIGTMIKSGAEKLAEFHKARHCLCIVFPLPSGRRRRLCIVFPLPSRPKTPPLHRLSTAFGAKTSPLHRVSTAFATKYTAFASRFDCLRGEGTTFPRTSTVSSDSASRWLKDTAFPCLRLRTQLPSARCSRPEGSATLTSKRWQVTALKRRTNPFRFTYMSSL